MRSWLKRVTILFGFAYSCYWKDVLAIVFYSRDKHIHHKLAHLGFFDGERFADCHPDCTLEYRLNLLLKFPELSNKKLEELREWAKREYMYTAEKIMMNALCTLEELDQLKYIDDTTRAKWTNKHTRKS